MKTILVVDDSSELQMLIGRVLSPTYNVVAALSGSAALDAVESIRPDLIILDLGLPDIDGYELCNRFKNSEKFRSIPIVILSARTGSDAHTVAYKLGADNYLEKPFSKEELLALVESKFKNVEKSVASSFKNLSIDSDSLTAFVENEKVDLAPKEFLVLKVLLTGFGEVISRKHILDAVWKDELPSTDRVVDNNINSLRRKLRASQLQIEGLYGKGYRIDYLKETP